MKIELDPEQQLLRDTAAKFIKNRLPLAAVRAIAEGEREVDAGYLPDTAELGWYAMFVDEEFGGGSVSGDPTGEAAIIAELRGAQLQPEPFVTANAAAALISRHGTVEQRTEFLPSAAAADAFCELPLTGDASWGPAGVTLHAVADGDALVLDGRVLAAESAAASALVVVVEPVPGERRAAIVRGDTQGVSVGQARGLDLTRAARSVTFDKVRVERSAIIPVDAAQLDHELALAVTLSLAETAGAMDALFELTRQYSLDRFAFGRPIGSFQALKHIIVDLSLTVEFAKALSASAAQAWREGAPYAAESASIAKVFLAERGLQFVQGCQQVYGGIGFAWEHDLHLYMRRIVANLALYGTADQHRARILDAHRADLTAAGALA